MILDSHHVLPSANSSQLKLLINFLPVTPGARDQAGWEALGVGWSLPASSSLGSLEASSPGLCLCPE